MKITVISDTHNKHLEINPEKLSGGDMIIHCGDVSSIGKEKEIIDFLDWYNTLPYTYKIFIAGNHDFLFENLSWSEINNILSKYPSIIYLNDNWVEIEGFKIWGSPVQPWFHNWAFNRVGEDIKKHWDIIPNDIDILIVHGGPKYAGYLNRTLGGEDVGCPFLSDTISNLSNLKLFCQGHIHEGRGYFKTGDNKLLVNASVLNRNYVMVNDPYVIDTDDWSIIDG